MHVREAIIHPKPAGTGGPTPMGTGAMRFCLSLPGHLCKVKMVMEAAIGDYVFSFIIATNRDTALGLDLYSFDHFRSAHICTSETLYSGILRNFSIMRCHE